MLKDKFKPHKFKLALSLAQLSPSLFLFLSIFLFLTKIVFGNNPFLTRTLRCGEMLPKKFAWHLFQIVLETYLSLDKIGSVAAVILLMWTNVDKCHHRPSYTVEYFHVAVRIFPVPPGF